MNNRVGNFSSSEIHRVITDRKLETYVEEKRFEIKLGRSINTETNARPIHWGRLVEEQAWNKLGFEYELVSKDRLWHPMIDHWCGVPDVRTDDMIGDIKSPWTMKSFCQLVEIIEKQDTEYFKKVHPDYYWQLVSNAILADVDKASFIVYCPYQKDLDEIRKLAEDYPDPNAVAFINWASDYELPYLKEDGEYTDLNVWEFEVPTEDKELLTERVKLAVSKL